MTRFLMLLAAALDGQGLLGGLDRGLERAGAGVQGDVLKRLREGSPGRLSHLAARLIDCLARDLAKALGVEFIQRHADDPAAGNEAGAAQMEQSRQQLPSRQVAGGADENNDLRIPRTHP